MSESETHLCVQCRTESPTTETAHTLISARHGWRLAPRVLPNGNRVLEWRCPECWRKYRKLSAGESPPASR